MPMEIRYFGFSPWSVLALAATKAPLCDIRAKGVGFVIGSGSLRRIEEETDRDGISTAEYVAGRIPGRVSIGVTVRSTAPTEEELLAARELALAVVDYDFY